MKGEKIMENNRFTQSDQVSKKIILAIVGTGMMSFCGVLLETSMNVTFPTLMRQFNVSVSNVQWITSGYLLIAALVMALASYIHKRFKLKNIYTVSVVLFILGLLLCVFAQSFPVLLAGRLIGGIATGLTTPLMFSIINHDIPIQKLGRYTAIGAIIISMAPTIGPTYGGLVSYYFGWRLIFWIVLPVSIIAAIIGILNIEQNRNTQHPKLDILGFAWIAAAFILIALAFNEASTHGWASTGFWLMLVIGLLSAGLYAWHAIHVKSPLINIKIFTYQPFVLSFLAYALCQLINLGMSFLLPNFGQLVLGSNALLAGFLLLPGSVLRIFIMPWGGNLLDRKGPSLPILTGISCILVSGVLYFSFMSFLTIPLMTFFYVFYSIGFSLTYSNTLANGMRQLPMHLKDDGNAAFNAIQQYSGSIGTSLMATLIAISQMNAQAMSEKEAIARGSSHDFILLIIMSIALLGIQGLNFKIQKNTASNK
ncbi:MFS transporter [Pediococcus ethanolidurans]|uniref:MFS transporter n=1 Tax=Pediococcus ethanolidurans TaxID=319653 RepID=UPI0021AA2BD4|nr:MFS transporter [Pediococcus ethanolidurans]MCT4398253.1 MFS transporter [Pediococcus ethanolidurans]